MRAATRPQQASFSCPKADHELISKIVDRGMEMAEKARRTDITKDRMSITMDITACHCSGNPLRLEDFLAADGFNFSHDFFGINRHIDRVTGQMTDCFVPRFSKRD